MYILEPDAREDVARFNRKRGAAAAVFAWFKYDILTVIFSY